VDPSAPITFLPWDATPGRPDIPEPGSGHRLHSSSLEMTTCFRAGANWLPCIPGAPQHIAQGAGTLSGRAAVLRRTMNTGQRRVIRFEALGQGSSDPSGQDAPYGRPSRAENVPVVPRQRRSRSRSISGRRSAGAGDHAVGPSPFLCRELAPPGAGYGQVTVRLERTLRTVDSLRPRRSHGCSLCVSGRSTESPIIQVDVVRQHRRERNQ
jgi:hypothetical protein